MTVDRTGSSDGTEDALLHESQTLGLLWTPAYKRIEGGPEHHRADRQNVGLNVIEDGWSRLTANYHGGDGPNRHLTVMRLLSS